MRLIGPNGEQVGILPTREALDRARELGLDLVEVSPNSRPPVCRIMDFGKYKYELSKKDKIAKKKQHTFQMKEMRFRPKIDDHDFTFKTKHIREFLESGSKVKAMVLFRGREMAHIEFGRDLMERVIKELADVAMIDMPAKLEGNSLSAVLAPKPEVIRKAQASKVAQMKLVAGKAEKAGKDTPEAVGSTSDDEAQAEGE